MPQPTPLQQAVFQASGFGKKFGPADVSRVLDELAIVAALCLADPIRCDRFIERFERALAQGEWHLADRRARGVP